HRLLGQRRRRDVARRPDPGLDRARPRRRVGSARPLARRRSARHLPARAGPLPWRPGGEGGHRPQGARPGPPPHRLPPPPSPRPLASPPCARARLPPPDGAGGPRAPPGRRPARAGLRPVTRRGLGLRRVASLHREPRYRRALVGSASLALPLTFLTLAASLAF